MHLTKTKHEQRKTAKRKLHELIKSSIRPMVIVKNDKILGSIKNKRKMQDLMNIPLVGHSRARAFIDMGIRTIDKVAKINPLDPAFQRYNCFSISSLELIKNYAKAIVQNKIIVRGKHPFFNSSNKIFFFDAEYNPNGTRTGPYGIFLIGIMDKDGKVTQYFLDEPKDEKRILKQFREWLIREKPTLVSYSSTSADKPQLLNALTRLKIPTKEFENAFFDLYYDCINTQRIETQLVFLPMRGSMNLKDVATSLGYKQLLNLKISNGFQALITYEEYLRTKKERLKLNLLKYNWTDLERTKFIFDKICKTMKSTDKYLESANLQLVFNKCGTLKRSNNIEDYICPKCGHFHSSKLVKRLLPIKCYRCGYIFNKRNTTKTLSQQRESY